MWVKGKSALKHKLISNGLEIGQLSFEAKIEKPFTYSQSLGGILSNGKLVNFTSVITSNTSSNNPKIKNLISLTKKLSALYEKKDKIAGWDFDTKELENYKNNVTQAYKALQSVCNETERNWRNIFTYNNHDNLMEGTEAFINLVSLMYERKERLEPFEKSDYYKLLYSILDRGELKIDSVDFKQPMNYNIKKKIEVNKKLYKLFIDLLQGVKSDFNTNMTKDQIQFNCFVMGRMTFQSSSFRKALVLKYKSNNIELNDEVEDSLQHSIFISFQNLFTKLETLTDCSQEKTLLEKVIGEFVTYSFNKFIFLNFAKEFMTLVSKIIGDQTVSISKVYGYEAMRQQFINEFLSKRSVNHIELVGKVANAMMFDNKNFQLFIVEMLKNYNPKNREDVEYFYYILSQCGKYFIDNHVSFPMRFKLDWMETNIFDLVNEDQLVGIFESINFVYKHYFLFHLNVQKRMIKVFSKVVSLLLHWDKGVQQLFANLIFFRFFNYQELNCDAGDEIASFIRSFIVFKEVGDEYRLRLRVWEHKSVTFKMKHSLTKIRKELESSVTEIYLKADAYNSTYIKKLPISLESSPRSARTSFVPLNIEARDIIYCEDATKVIESTFDEFLTSRFRARRNEEDLPQVCHMLSLDKNEPKTK